ncbi:unnamed protein product [Cuscuta europaea]|uniref:Uncharacterized protein n=1 Tax=Cuscuta europaea TaxID=41803 RepID=A0A9P0ZJ34_CUSEU|nr:unnamed protein product [Cuscuta europaea]
MLQEAEHVRSSHNTPRDLEASSERYEGRRANTDVSRREYVSRQVQQPRQPGKRPSRQHSSREGGDDSSRHSHRPSRRATSPDERHVGSQPHILERVVESSVQVQLRAVHTRAKSTLDAMEDLRLKLDELRRRVVGGEPYVADLHIPEPFTRIMMKHYC